VSFPLRVGFDEHPLMLDGRVSLFGEGSSYRAGGFVRAGFAVFRAQVGPRHVRLLERTCPVVFAAHGRSLGDLLLFDVSALTAGRGVADGLRLPIVELPG
jgi:hypothetical protein